MKFVKNIGRGGFGVVDEVQNDDGTHLARKTFSINQPYEIDHDFEMHIRERFSREISIQSSFTNPNIVPVIDSDLNAEPPYFLMPLADSSLDRDIKADKSLGGNFLQAISDIISGLEEMHSLKYYHRDLKPQNVLRFSERNTSSDESRYYAVSDFGLVALKSTQVSNFTPTGMRMGSDYYTAPEIVADLRNASARSDIFSLGCILHDFVGLRERVPCNEIREDGPYGGILLNCTRRDRSRRFDSVSAVRDALLAVGHHPPASLTSGANEVVVLLDSEPPLTASEWKSIVDFLNRVQLENRSASLPKPIGGRRSDQKSTGLELDAV
jgi:serine/threonine protein kinase